MGIGLSFFTEGVGAGPRKHMDILGLGMADGCELRVHPTGKAQLRLSVQTQGQGHETTFAQIVAHELGIPPEDVEVIHGDTDNTPVRPRHLRLAVDAGVRCRRRGRGPPGQGQGPHHRRRGARVLARRPRVGARPLVREGRPRAGQDDPGDRLARPTAPSSCPRASRATSTRRRSTTRPTSPTRSAPTSAWSTWTPAPAR